MTITEDDLTERFLKFVSSGDISESDLEQAKSIIRGQDQISVPLELVDDSTEAPEASVPLDLPPPPKIKPEEQPVEDASVTSDLRFQISNMSIPEKIKLAMLGNKECRTILIGDKNRCIQEFVLANPKLQMTEVIEFASNPKYVGSRIATDLFEPGLDENLHDEKDFGNKSKMSGWSGVGLDQVLTRQ